MSYEYTKYISDHKVNVRLAWEWMLKNIPEVILKLYDIEPGEYLYNRIDLIANAMDNIIDNHDESKHDLEEYGAYDEYFYGNKKDDRCLKEFNYAWLHHIHHNPHHWQYWVLNNDDPKEGEIIVDMTTHSLIEMVCDWWSFSWKSNNLTEIFDFYESRKDYIKLSEKTRKNVEFLLNGIKNKLEEIEK